MVGPVWGQREKRFPGVVYRGVPEDDRLMGHCENIKDHQGETSDPRLRTRVSIPMWVMCLLLRFGQPNQIGKRVK